jgi:hypothetical protein
LSPAERAGAAQLALGRIGGREKEALAEIYKEGQEKIAGVWEQHQKDLKSIEKDIEAKRSRLRGMEEEYRQLPTKSSWETASTGKRIVGMLSIAIGGALAHKYGRKNLALETLNNMIDRDLQSKRMELDKHLKGMNFKRNLLTENYQLLGDEREAMALTRAQLTQNVADQANATTMKYASQRAVQQGKLLSAQLEMGATQAINSMLEAEKNRRVQILEKARRTEEHRLNLAQRERERKTSAYIQLEGIRSRERMQQRKEEAASAAGEAAAEAAEKQARRTGTLVGTGGEYIGMSRWTGTGKEKLISDQLSAIRRASTVRRLVGDLENELNLLGRKYGGPLANLKVLNSKDRKRVTEMINNVAKMYGKSMEGARQSDLDFKVYKELFGGSPRGWLEVANPADIVADRKREMDDAMYDNLQTFIDPYEEGREERIDSYVNSFTAMDKIDAEERAKRTETEEAVSTIEEAELEAAGRGKFPTSLPQLATTGGESPTYGITEAARGLYRTTPEGYKEIEAMKKRILRSQNPEATEDYKLLVEKAEASEGTGLLYWQAIADVVKGIRQRRDAGLIPPRE